MDLFGQSQVGLKFYVSWWSRLETFHTVHVPLVMTGIQGVYGPDDLMELQANVVQSIYSLFLLNDSQKQGQSLYKQLKFPVLKPGTVAASSMTPNSTEVSNFRGQDSRRGSSRVVSKFISSLW